VRRRDPPKLHALFMDCSELKNDETRDRERKPGVHRRVAHRAAAMSCKICASLSEADVSGVQFFFASTYGSIPLSTTISRHEKQAGLERRTQRDAMAPSNGHSETYRQARTDCCRERERDNPYLSTVQ